MDAQFEKYDTDTDCGVIVKAVYVRSTRNLIVSCEGYHAENESESNYHYRATHVSMDSFDYRIVLNDVKSFLFQGECDNSMTYDDYAVLNSLYLDMK